MAEVRKQKKNVKYDIDDISVKSKKVKETEEKSLKKTAKKETKKVENKKEKKSLWVKFRIFCHGVKSEFGKVHWPSKGDMVRYSVATIFFVVFCSLFFYLIDIIFALVQSLFN